MNASKDEPEENNDMVTFVRILKILETEKNRMILEAIAANFQIKQKSMRYVS